MWSGSSQVKHPKKGPVQINPCAKVCLDDQTRLELQTIILVMTTEWRTTYGKEEKWDSNVNLIRHVS